MRVKVISEPFPTIDELEEGLAYIFKDRGGSFKGFLFPVDVKALKLLGVKDTLKFSYSRMPPIIRIPSPYQVGTIETKPDLPFEKVKVEIPPIPREVFRVAQKSGFRVYLVGGGVRDLLSGRYGDGREEWDFVVTAGFEPFSRVLQKRFKAKSLTHPSYCTASLVLEGVIRVDLSRPRFEFYNPSGKIAQIKKAPFYLDLLRRDFTINAMALYLKNGEVVLIDPWGGVEDLKNGILRIMRPYAFLEDSLRILRMVRYAITLGFKPGEREEELLKEALEEIPKGPASYLDPRFGRELAILLTSPVEGLKSYIDRYHFLSLLKPVHREVNGEALVKASHLFQILPLKERVRREDYLILFLLSYLKKEEALNLLHTLSVNLKGLNVRRILSFDVREKEVFLRKAPYNLLACLLAIHLARSSLPLKEGEEKLRLFLKNLVSAEDLKGLGIRPGPLFQAILREVKIRTLEGTIKDREEALAYLKK